MKKHAMTMLEIMEYCKDGKKEITMSYNAKCDGLKVFVSKGNIEEGFTIDREALDVPMHMGRILEDIDFLLDFTEARLKEGAQIVRASKNMAHYNIDNSGVAECSACGERYVDVTKRFCPNCGRMMVGKKHKNWRSE